MYEYRAQLIRVVDGDTLDLEVDLGFGIAKADRFRLAGINAPEVRGADKARGELATMCLRDLLENAADGWVTVRTTKDKREKYGRYLAQVLVTGRDGTVTDVGAALVTEGLAAPYYG